MGKVIRLTESDLVRIVNKVIWEQPDSKFDTPHNKELMRQQQSKLPSLSMDDTVDIISAIFDGIPGVGNLISAGIDVSHVVSYIVRYNFEKDESKKIEYAIMAVITLLGTLLPVGGNSLIIMSRKGLKEVMKETPLSILKILQKYGLYKKGPIFVKQSRWKYSLLILLCRILGSDVVEYYTQTISRLKSLDQETKEYAIVNNSIKDFIDNLENLKPYLDVASVVAKELNKIGDIQTNQ